MTTRRLAAIAVLDVVGYSSMMAADEEGTLASLKAHRNEVDPILLNHGCRIVKGTGDGLLVEVPSVVEAVAAAVAVQDLMAERNAALPAGRRMVLRIGINLGDILVDDDGDVFGDGVNVAARLESLAEPGGICVSDSVRTHVEGKLDLDFDDVGAVDVKGIGEPIRAWKVRFDRPATGAPPPRTERFVATVAVLPFDNMSGDDDQQYLADGITEDLITSLSHHVELRVVARNSTFAYRGQAVDVRKVARELDATHIVEGSVRRAGDRVRITAQLIEAETGHHIWAERFDRDLADVFELQDEIVHETAAHVHPAIERVETEKRTRRSPAELDAWDLLLRARWHANTNTRDGLEEGIRLAELALERDPDFIAAHHDLTNWWITVAFNRWPMHGRNAFEENARHAEAAYRLDPSHPHSLTAMAAAEVWRGNLEHAADLSNRAYQRSRHGPIVSLVGGIVDLFSGEFDAAVEHFSEAWRAARHEPWRYHIATNQAFSHYLAGRYEPALAWAERGLAVSDYLQLRGVAAAALGQLGRGEEARQHLAHITIERSGLTAAEFGRNIMWRHQRDIDHYLEGLVKAGMPL